MHKPRAILNLKVLIQNASHYTLITMVWIATLHTAQSQPTSSFINQLNPTSESETSDMTHTPQVLVLLPNYGYDPTEVAVPWNYLVEGGYDPVFATPDGARAFADEIVLSGERFPFWVRSQLKADREGIEAYRQMITTDRFRNPIAYSEIRGEDYVGLFIPGGHEKTMKIMLESQRLQELTTEFFLANKPVAAVCHGVLLVARAKYADGTPILKGRKTTALTRFQERFAYQATRSTLGLYYITYPGTTVEEEVRASLISPEDFQSGGASRFLGVRDSRANPEKGFTVVDQNYVSARYYGDANRLGKDFVKVLNQFVQK
jgi:protease I